MIRVGILVSICTYNIIIYIYRKCGSTVYVGLTGTFSDANTKVYGDGHAPFKCFF